MRDGEKGGDVKLIHYLLKGKRKIEIKVTGKKEKMRKLG